MIITMMNTSNAKNTVEPKRSRSSNFPPSFMKERDFTNSKLMITTLMNTSMAKNTVETERSISSILRSWFMKEMG